MRRLADLAGWGVVLYAVAQWNQTLATLLAGGLLILWANAPRKKEPASGDA